MECADFGPHALLHEWPQFALIVNLDQFLRPIGWIGYVELHLNGCATVKTGQARLSI